MSKKQVQLKSDLDNNDSRSRQHRLSQIRKVKGSGRKKRLPPRRKITPRISVEGIDEVLPERMVVTLTRVNSKP